MLKLVYTASSHVQRKSHSTEPTLEVFLITGSRVSVQHYPGKGTLEKCDFTARLYKGYLCVRHYASRWLEKQSYIR